MSIWKSPVFYFGIVLLAVVGLLLVAPFVINWGSYRDNLEHYGRQISGRAVAINGPIAVRLFPWPRLVAQDVSVGNPQEMDGPPTLSAKTVQVELALAGLFGGELQVETIALEEPTFTLARLDNGLNNWVFQPEQELQKLKLLDHVKLDQITLNNGTLRVQDRAHHYDLELTKLNAVLSAGSIEGPWRVHATAQQKELPLDINVTTTAWTKDQPLKFSLRVAAQDGSLPAFQFDAETSKNFISGKMRLEPVVTADGRQSLEGSFKPLQMKADLKIDYNTLALTDIHIVPADAKDSGTLIEGTAAVDFSNAVKVKLALNSPRINLDALAGSQSLRVWRAGGAMALLNTLILEFPAKLDLDAAFNVANFSVAGETLENFVVQATAQQDALRITNLSANLPGRSRLKFEGIAFPGEVAAELGGTLALESSDTRQFVQWLWPEGKGDVAKIWTGNRGRLKAETELTWSGNRFGLQNLNYELDGAAGLADLAIRLGPLPGLNMKLDAVSLNIDDYIANGGFAALAAPGALAALQSDSGFEKKLQLTAKSLRLNGVDAKTVALNFASTLSGFEVQNFSVGSIEGAKLSGQGLILNSPAGPSGDFKLHLQAESPTGFLQLVGLAPRDNIAPWTEVLGATDLQSTISVKPGQAEPSVDFLVEGSSGPLRVQASGTAENLSQGSSAQLGLSAEVASDDGAQLLRLLALETQSKEIFPGQLTLTASGSAGAGFKVAAHAEALAAQVDYGGSVKLSPKFPQLAGKLNITTDHLESLMAAIGVADRTKGMGTAKISADVSPVADGVAMINIVADISGQHMTGAGSYDASGKLSADLNLEKVDLGSVLALGFMPWQGGNAALDSALASAPKLGNAAEIWLRPDVLQTGLDADLKEAVIGFTADLGGRAMSVAARGADGEPFKLDVGVKPMDGAQQLSVSAHFPLDLTRNFNLADGTAVANGKLILDGKLVGVGRSPLAAISSGSGQGTYILRNGNLLQLSPAPFFVALAKIKDAGDMQSAFDILLQGPGLALSSEKLNVDLQNGVANFQPLKLTTPDAEIALTPSFDFSDLSVLTDVVLTPKNHGDLPAMRVTYSGPPSALMQHSDTAALSAKLGYALIAKDMAELDRVQKEQAKLVAAEEAQQKADEEKFAAYQAQRMELRLRAKEMRVHAAQRLRDAAAFKVDLAKALQTGIAITKLELPNLQRLLQTP